MKRMIAAILCLCLLCAAGVPAKCVSAVPELAILLYMTGSDLESKDGTASRDLREIMEAGVDYDRTNVIVCAGGTQ